MEKYLYIYSEVTVMGEETAIIPFPEVGTDPLEISDFTYSVSRHGVPMITATVKAPYSLLGKWNHRQFVTFRGVRYNIDEIPTLKRSNNNEYELYELQMFPEWNVVTKTYFYDVVDSSVSDSSEKYFSNSTNVTFYGTLGEFVSRINASFKKSGIGYRVAIRNSTIADTSLLEDVREYSGDKLTLLDALKKAFEVWKIPFYYDNGTFYFGFYKNDLDIAVQYGQDKELLSVEKNNAHANIITRATGVGSEQNIPHYYPNDTERGDIGYSIALPPYSTNVLIEGKDYVVPDKNKLANALKTESEYYYREIKTHINANVSDVLLRRNNNPWNAIEGFDNSTNKNVTTLQHTIALDQSSEGVDNTHSFRIVFKVTNKGKMSFNFVGRLTDMILLYDDSYFQPINLYKIPSTVIGQDLNNLKTIGYLPSAYISKSWVGGGKKDYNFTDTAATYILEYRNADIKSIRENLQKEFEVIDKYVFKAEIAEVEATKKYEWWSATTNNRAEFNTLREIGVAYDEPDIDGIRLQFSIKGLQPYQSRLMPSIFTRGKAFNGSVGNGTKNVERYYNALNNLYPDDKGYYLQYNTPYNGKNRSEKLYEYDDIKPEIKGVKNASGQLIGEIADAAYDYDDSDYIKGTGDDGTSYQHPYFYVKLHKTDSANGMGFNLFNYALASEPMTLQITSGSLAGCSFKVQVVEVSPNKFGNPILTDASGNLKADSNGNVSYLSCVSANTSQFVAAQQDTKANEVWIALLKEDSTFGVIMPNVENNFKIKAGDTFNIININLPKEYILQAEQRLDDAIVRDMQTDNMERFNFAIDFSRIFLAEDYDENELKEKAGIYSTLDEASRIMVYTGDKDADGNELWAYQYVESYTYECKASEMLPKISLTLVNDIVNKESIAEMIARQSASVSNVRNVSQSAVLRAGEKLSDYGISDAYISDDGTIVLGTRSIKPIVTDLGGGSSSGGSLSPTELWAELTKVDSTKVIDDSHISENIARTSDLQWRIVTSE